ncbi:unnamed protein product [Anisakis simplex]|uniref:BRCT domain-containing protein n=1 Tax=Anisakis simplex TaxID=6269 RepID=A0A0M3IXY1_ANISI|nr:unnamed protein product [Anisakis simplex]
MSETVKQQALYNFIQIMYCVLSVGQEDPQATTDIMQVMRKGVFGKSISYLQTTSHEDNESGKKDVTTELKEGEEKSGNHAEQLAENPTTAESVTQPTEEVEHDPSSVMKTSDEVEVIQEENIKQNADECSTQNETDDKEKKEVKEDNDDTKISEQSNNSSTSQQSSADEEKATRDDADSQSKDVDISGAEVISSLETSEVGTKATSQQLTASKDNNEGEKSETEEVLQEKHTVCDNEAEGNTDDQHDTSSDKAVDDVGELAAQDDQDEQSAERTDEEPIPDSNDDHKIDQSKLSIQSNEQSTADGEVKESVEKEQDVSETGGDNDEKAALERRRSLRPHKQISYSDTRPVSASDSKTAKRDAKKTTESKTTTNDNTPTVKKSETTLPQSRRSAKEKESESTSAESAATTPKRRPQSKAASSSRRSTPASITEASQTRRKPTSAQPKGHSFPDDDPFSLENNIDNHPQPLRNIQMERQSFGNIKFTKASNTPDTSLNRYEKTEQTASERRSNLPDLHGVVHKSLSELSTIRRTPVSRKLKKIGSISEDINTNEEAANSNVDDEPMDVNVGNEPVNGEHRSASTTATPKSHAKKTRVTKAESAPAMPNTKKRRIEQTSTEVVPKKAHTKPLPVLDIDEQFAVDHRENEHTPYEIGARVYALWGREYYAAKVSAERDSSGRYELMFVEDEEVRRLVVTGIIPLTALVTGKNCLTTIKKNDEDVIEEVEIVKSPSSTDKQEWMEALLQVKSVEHGNEYNVSWAKLWLNSSQANALATAKVNTACDVMADNIDTAESRRSRAKRHTHAPEEAATPVAARSPKKSKSASIKGKRTVTENEDVSESTATNANSSTLEGGNIFSGIAVVITSAMRKNKDEEQAFSKREVRQMIESHGGIVSDDFTKIASSEKVLLIADTHYRTHKYLSALARSVPCVRHQWIRDCVEQNKLLDYKDYMLPAGISLLTNKIVPWHANNGRLLEGKRVLLSTRNFFPETQMPNFAEIWAPLIKQMGAEVVDQMPSDGVDILLTDASCSDDVLAQARECNAIIVSSEWIIQSIIHGNLPDPTAHERFQYNFVDSQ